MANLNLRRLRDFLTLIIFMMFAPYSSQAQSEYLATLNYNNLALNRVGIIPGVLFVTDKSTYDQNHQRFFFSGHSNGTAPGQLYTINAVTGATIYNPLCPAGNTGGSIFGLQYDNATDTLYALYTDFNGTAYFSWVDPSTGIVNIVSNIPGFQGYIESAFDTKDHMYILNGGSRVIGIDASSGNIVYILNNTSVYYMMFNNLNGKLYGINFSNSLSNPQFDSISLSAGLVYPIANLPNMSYLQIGAFAIDENAGKFIAVVRIPSSSCTYNYIYVLDIQTGTVLSSTSYPYGQNTSAFNNENAIEYSFDNARGKLYTLNWHLPGDTLVTAITASPGPYCAGTTITFTAIAATGFVNPSYQWQVNGNDVGANSSTYFVNSLAPGDGVRCIITNNSPCIINPSDTSNNIFIQFGTPVKPSVSIVASATTICINQPDTFIAHTTNSGLSPVFQWQLNGNNVGTNDSVFASSSLVNGDSINCIITTNSNCVLPGSVSSNAVVIQVNSVNSSVSITASSDVICSGDTVLFTASPVNGGISPVFQWQVNRMSTGDNSNMLNIASLMNGDVINCIMTSSISCAIPVPSANSITMTVSPVPVISFNPDTLTIRPGENTKLNPLITGTAASYQWNPLTALDNPSEISPIADPAGTTTYFLTVTGNDGCKATGKETVLVYTKLEMPNAFTPNGDGINDVFRIPPSTPQKIQSFSVYNRWGARVFTTDNSGTGWDGTFNNKQQPAGEYVWMIRYTDLLNGNAAVASGTVLLIR